MHLGHPISTGLQQTTAHDVLLHKFKEELSKLNAQLTPTFDRVAIPSSIVIPGVLYRAECMPLTTEQLQRLNALMRSFVLPVSRLPPNVADKSIYSHTKIDLGVPYLCTCDAINNHPYMTSLRIDTCFALAPRVVYQTAVARLRPVLEPAHRPLDVYFDAKRLLPQRRGPQDVLSLEVYEITQTKTSPPDGMVYTDGSRIEQPLSA